MMRRIWENEWSGFMSSSNVTDLINKTDCSGCGACVCACPIKCISMKCDSEGFSYPQMGDKSCINCGKCLSVCPVKAKPKATDYHRRVFAVQHKDDRIRRESTSGGAFTAIAEYVIENGGIVFGAGMDENFRVRHMPAYDKAQLASFRNSKYSQSDLGDTFLKIKKDLAEGKKILFSGTPCQVAGLKKFLPDAGENLITEACLYHNGLEYDPMLKLFYQGMICRPACSDCRFKGMERCSDFTLWDCFSAAEINSDFDDNKGTTFVMLHSKKAEMIFEKIQDNIRSCEGETARVCRSCAEMFQSISHNPERQNFFRDMDSMPPDELFDKWAPITWKVRVNKLLRNVLAKLGLYYTVKNFAAKLKK